MLYCRTKYLDYTQSFHTVESVGGGTLKMYVHVLITMN